MWSSSYNEIQKYLQQFDLMSLWLIRLGLERLTELACENCGRAVRYGQVTRKIYMRKSADVYLSLFSSHQLSVLENC